ncbi:hypothetical protein [Halorubellus sp. PRR65]|uniref:hypothetical protein n=1 Tax=Halorubellus sp. PRR65 TaxID=3098148 RepID=UPI002B25EA15|nr:hypothetical protein [Halorubellus sp. PRR65]
MSEDAPERSTDDTGSESRDPWTDGGQPVQAGQMTGSRRKYLKYLIALAVGIPVALEAGTFLGLLQGQVGEERGLSVGDDLLAETSRPETVNALAVTGGTFELSVSVENTGDVPYGVSISEVKLSDGETLAGDASVGPIAAGESATLAGEWALPSGVSPTALVVTAREYGGETSEVVAASTVSLALEG